MKDNGMNFIKKNEEDINIKWFIVKGLQHWKWFIASLLVCLVVSYVYLKYSTKVYNVNAGIILKDDKKGGLGNSEVSTFEELGLLKTNNNVDNEVEMLKSRNLVEGVVKELKLYITYQVKDHFETVELYGEENPYYSSIPIKVYMEPNIASQINGSIDLEISMAADSSILVEGAYNNRSFSQVYAALPAVMSTPAGEILLQPVEQYFNEKPKIVAYPTMPGTMQTPVGEAKIETNAIRMKEELPLYIQIKNPLAVAKHYVSNLNIQPSSKTTSVVRFSLRETHPLRGEDFLRKLIDLYNRDAIEDKNKAAQNAADFIDERLSYINQDLNTSEMDIEAYKRNHRLTDIASESELFLNEGNDFGKQLSDIAIQLQLTGYLQSEVEKVKTTKELLPGSLGISDPSIVAGINQYNAAVLEKDRLLSYSSKNSPVVVRIDEKISSLRDDVASSISGIQIALKAKERSLSKQTNRYDSQISSIPLRERELTEKKRQQQIKETLFVMLLEKKEEAALSLAVTVPSAKIIESPLAENTPIAPKRMVVFLASFLIGLIIPTAGIGLKESLNYKIENEDDIKYFTNIPIMASLPLDKSKENIVITPNAITPIAETFRLLRANIRFHSLKSPDKKVILITSSIPGEGKTFTSINLAMAFALKYKTLIVGLDIRKPRLGENLGLSGKEGAVSYLYGETDSVDAIIQPSGIHENLDVITTGVIPPNPNELLMEHTLDKLFEELRKRYEYIIIDTSPVGSVSDTFLIDRVSDATLVVVRSDYTPKGSLDLLESIKEEGRLKNMQLVFNGIPESNLKKYGYGYTYSYGYSRGYKHNGEKS